MSTTFYVRSPAPFPAAALCSPPVADGTKPETVDAIVEQGMDHRLSGGMLGQGTYFAEASSKSDQYVGTGRCFIFLARSVSWWLRSLREYSPRLQGGARNPALYEQWLRAYTTAVCRGLPRPRMQAPPLRFGDLHPSGDFREFAVYEYTQST